MGASTAGLFSDDTAQDVRSTWTRAFRATGSAAAATASMNEALLAYRSDADDGPVATLALAVVLWTHGCLTETARAAAIGVIERGEGLDRWRDQSPATLRARLKEYERIRVQLESPQPPSKEGTLKLPKAENAGLVVGDIFSVPLPEPDGGRGYFKVVGLGAEFRDVWPIVRLLRVPPDADAALIAWETVVSIGFRDFANAADPNHRRGEFLISGWNARGWDRRCVRVHARVSVRTADQCGPTQRPNWGVNWAELAKQVRPSLDTSVWHNASDVLAMIRACELKDVALLRPVIELAGRRTECMEAFTRAAAHWLSSAYGDYERALEVLDLGVSIDPAVESGIVRGHALLGLGQDQASEAIWSRELESTGQVRINTEVSIRGCREEVAARRAGRPLKPCSNRYFKL